MRAVASRWGGGCPGHRTPRPGGSPSPPPVCAGADRARGGGPGAEGRDRAGRLVERAAISSGSRSGSPAGRRLAVSASASRRVTPTPPSAGCTQRSRGGMTPRRRSLLPGHRAARASTASAHWVRLLPDSSAARAAGRCTDPEAYHSDRWTSPASCRGLPMLAKSPRTAAVTMRRGSSRQKPPGRRRRRRPAGHGAARAARPRPRR